MRVRLGGRMALDGADFSARPGALTAIVGPNGSGKTTLMRALTGELSGRAIAAGCVTLDGRPLAQLDPTLLAQRRAVLPQASALAFPFTVLEVVRLGAADPAAAVAALAQVGLAGFGGRFYQELSGGEQQRAQLARALAQVARPPADGAARWLLLDEPVASLDIRHQIAVMRLARGFARSGGGVIAVMHDLNLTALFADAVAVMVEGRIVAAGPPEAALTDAVLSAAYACELRVNMAPAKGLFVLPHAPAGALS
nr:heme ABC transporter ATP-binding protein [Rubrimonas cliftonensis]